MSKYRPMSGVFVGRPPCDICHAAYRLHEPDGTCLQQYRPDSLEQAETELAEALRSGDPARIFVARGEVQRLKGR